MNKRTLKKLMVLGCITSVFSCCNFIGAMNNEKSNGTNKSSGATSKRDEDEKVIREMSTDEVSEYDFLGDCLKNTSKAAKAEDVDNVLFDESSYDSLQRLHRAFNMFRGMGSDAKKKFIISVMKHAKVYTYSAWADRYEFFKDNAWKNSEFTLDNNGTKFYEKTQEYFEIRRSTGYEIKPDGSKGEKVTLGFRKRDDGSVECIPWRKRRFGGYRVVETFVGKDNNQTNNCVSVTSTLDLWPNEKDEVRKDKERNIPNKEILKDDIVVEASIGENSHCRIRIGTPRNMLEQYVRCDGNLECRNNCWIIDMYKSFGK